MATRSPVLANPQPVLVEGDDPTITKHGQQPPGGPAHPEDGATDGPHATMSAGSGPTLAAAERWG
jgi:hypothetical protein